MKTRNLFYLLLTFVLAAGFTSCSDDDDDDVTNTSVVGTWTLKSVDIVCEGDTTGAASYINILKNQYPGVGATYVFSAENKLTVNPSEAGSSSFNGTYDYKDGILKFNIYMDYGPYTLTVSNHSMTATENIKDLANYPKITKMQRIYKLSR